MDLKKLSQMRKKGLKRYSEGNIGEHFPFSKITEILKEFENQKNRKNN